MHRSGPVCRFRVKSLRFCHVWRVPGLGVTSKYRGDGAAYRSFLLTQTQASTSLSKLCASMSANSALRCLTMASTLLAILCLLSSANRHAIFCMYSGLTSGGSVGRMPGRGGGREAEAQPEH